MKGAETMVSEICGGLISEFTENYMEKLFYFCLKRTGNVIEAEDLTHDIALNIISALSGGTVPVSFSAWVWQIARNRWCAWVKEKRKRNESTSDYDIGELELGEPAEAALIEDEIVRGEELSLLRRELAFIRSDCRNIVLAYYIENKSVRDIASSLSLSESAVKQRLFRARKILKEGMDMAREFGKLSYNPENITFVCNGVFGANGEPWTFLNRSLCKNIMLAAYRNPSTAEELALEVGVALPYMEEELNALVGASLMKKNENRYETAFFIVSAQAQEKISAHLRGLVPELTKAIIEALEFTVQCRNEKSPRWHGGYQSYEGMKWALLMLQTDTTNFDVLDLYNAGRKAPPKSDKGSFGHTKRPDGGEWDVVGMETFNGDRPAFVGLHGCVNSPEEMLLPAVDFEQFRFQYKGIDQKTPQNMPYSYAKALEAVVKGKGGSESESVLKRLEEYGYISESGGEYKPRFLVMYRDKCELTDSGDKEKADILRKKAAEVALRHYRFCREQICREIPDFLKSDEYQIEHACANIFAFRGAVLEESIAQGYLKFGENDDDRMFGAFMRI